MTSFLLFLILTIAYPEHIVNLPGCQIASLNSEVVICWEELFTETGKFITIKMIKNNGYESYS